MPAGLWWEHHNGKRKACIELAEMTQTKENSEQTGTHYMDTEYYRNNTFGLWDYGSTNEYTRTDQQLNSCTYGITILE